MHIMPLLLDLIPLFVFVVLDSIGKMRYALIGAITAACFELFFSYIAVGYIDSFSIIFAGSILLFAALSFYFNNSIYFRLKPAIIGGVTGLIVITTSFLNKPALLAMADHYSNFFPDTMQDMLVTQHFRDQLANTNGILGIGLIIHSSVTTWAAFNAGRWLWFFISTPGLYIIIFLSILVSI